MIPSIDDSVGAIYEALGELGALPNTALLFTSDNGLLLFEHGLARKGLAYEPSIRVPLVLRYPWLVPAGSRPSESVLNLDLTRTVLALANAPAPDSLEGRDLLTLFDANVPSWREDWVYVGAHLPGKKPPILAVRTSTTKYVIYLEEPVEEELFDLSTDPDERHNLAGDPEARDRLTGMRARLKRLASEEGLPSWWLEAER
jgi:arylsulfatase A-like enzyme